MMTPKKHSAIVTAIATCLSASVAPVPAESATIPTIAGHQINSIQPQAFTLGIPDGQVFLPLDKATDYLNQLNSTQRMLLESAIRDRQTRGKGALFATNEGRTKKICKEAIEQNMRVKEAINIVMQPDNLARLFPDNLEQRVHYRNLLIRFGRAIAQSEFIARDAINAMEQCAAPTLTKKITGMPCEEDVRAMVAAEHRNLGLSAPEFS
ncbi:iron-sulfur cluster assembly scaffold protein SufA [Escherichia coli]|uniref:iron-sulfur cluster assembly scaffold protein SufA n=1 Tax=Escherichia coli TaxID=562 RepID=UPI0037E1ED73